MSGTLETGVADVWCVVYVVKYDIVRHCVLVLDKESLLPHEKRNLRRSERVDPASI